MMDADMDEGLRFARDRRKVRALVMENRPVEAIKVVGERWPDVLRTPIGLDLRIQCLVDLISKRLYTDAIHFSRQELWPYLVGEDEVKIGVIKKAMGLFALPDLSSECAVATLAQLDKKRYVADNLNRTLLFHPNPPKPSALERILNKISVSAGTLREMAGDYGPEFDLRESLPPM